MDCVCSYKYYDIWHFGNYYSIFFEGDEVLFSSISKAKEFIDEVSLPYLQYIGEA